MHKKIIKRRILTAILTVSAAAGLLSAGSLLTAGAAPGSGQHYEEPADSTALSDQNQPETLLESANEEGTEGTESAALPESSESQQKITLTASAETVKTNAVAESVSISVSQYVESLGSDGNTPKVTITGSGLDEGDYTAYLYYKATGASSFNKKTKALSTDGTAVFTQYPTLSGGKSYVIYAALFLSGSEVARSETVTVNAVKQAINVNTDVTVSPSFEGQSTGSITVNGNYPALAYYPHGSSIANAVKVTGTTITGLAAGDYYVFVPAYSEGNTFYIRSTTTKKLTVGETEAAHYYVGLTSDEHSSWSDGDATLSVIQGAGRTLSLQVSIDNEYRNAYVLDSVTVNPANAVLKTEKVSDTLWNVLVSDITGDVTVAAHSKPIPEYRVTLSQKEGAKWLGNSGNESFSIKPTASKSVYVKPTDTERYYISGVTALPEQNADISFYQNTGEVFVQNVTGNVTLVPLVVEKSIPASITVTDVQFNRNGIYSEENPSIQTTFRVEVRDQFDQPIPGTKLYFKDDQSEVSFTQVRQTDSEGVASFKYSYGIQEGKATADYNAVFSTSSGFAAGEVTVQQAIHLVLQRKADLLLYQNQIIGTTPGENNGKVIDVPDNYEIWTGEVHQGAIVIGSGEWQRALNGEITGLSAGQHILRAGESVNETTHTFYFASDYADFFVPRGLWKVAVDVSASEHVSFPQGTELTAEPGVEVYLYAQPEEGYRINAYSVDKPSRIGTLDYDEDNGYFIIKGVSGNVILTVTAEAVQEESEEEESDDKEPADEEQVDEEQAEKNTTEYVFLEGSDGAWFKESNTFLRFRVDGEYEKFTGIQINHAPVPDTAYISERGSTIIIIKPEYLETLSLGKHTLTVGFSDGSAQTEFTVNQAKSGGNSPATGEGNGIATALAAMLLSLVAVTFAYRKKIRSLIIN